jgi:phospholipid/cholesterol/gamma-HCH transport system substrate-binding protein
MAKTPPPATPTQEAPASGANGATRTTPRRSWYSRLRSRLAIRAFTERPPKLIGVISIVVIAAAVVSVITLNSSLFQSSYQVKARFTNAIGIGPGAKVLLAGVPVGSVGSMSVTGNSVTLDLNINNGVVLPGDTSAAISVETLLGVTDVSLGSGTDWAHPLRSGSTITNTTAPIEFYDVQSAAGDLLTKTDATALANLVQELATVTTGRSTEVSAIVKGLDQFTGTISARQTQVSQLIDAAESLSTTLASRDSQLASVVDDLNTVVQGLAGRSGELGQLIDNTLLAASQTASLIGENHPRIQQLLNSLTVDLKVIGSHQVDLAQSVAYAGAAIGGFASVAQSGSTQSPWANIYVNLLAVSGAYTVLGSCGLLDQALDQALGPDPLPCNERTGPAPTASGSTSTLGGASTAPSTSGSSSSKGHSSTVTPSAPSAPSAPGQGGTSATSTPGSTSTPTSSIPTSPLSALLGPLAAVAP